MTSEVEIYNIALGNIGAQQVVASTTESSNEARACKRFYEFARNEALRALPWPFATRHITLALVEESPNTQWAYSYRYPSDCEKIRRVIPSDITVDTNYRDAWVVASDDAGKLIFSNQINAQVEYTHRISDPTLFDSLFIDALGWLLATKIAPSLSGNQATAIINRADAKYITARNQAEAEALNEGGVDTSPYCETVAGRE